ncbi:hypothetical protein DDZ13_04000 [Coraliomargarita sinensis]|uniref:Uncharacterized protein n=1 Tax=Coraliomargarita sinensis TaxID=2174842 RepID=A0A317ZJF8_9BACT|nr:hypothetical protein [Coraliomargarita sinensis]PXA05132.1 hypothetical protein DDZ13_04000 [Coraliomargarita sinensis]
MCSKPDFPPPPVRKEPRRLSLKMAIAAATRRESADVKPLLSPENEFPKIKSQSGKQQEMEAHLLELQADIINREELLAEKEKYLEARALELNEKEALLEAHKKVVDSKTSADASGDPKNHGEEMEALKALRAELETQEASLKEARNMLHEREAYIEKCENDLVEKSMVLTEREAQIEQREEDLGSNDKNGGS